MLYHMGMTNMVCLIEICLKALAESSHSSQWITHLDLLRPGLTFERLQAVEWTFVSGHKLTFWEITNLYKMSPGVLNCPHREVPRSISFSGSGFLATYQLGVAQCLLTQTPWMLRTAPLVLGTSAGSLVAAAVVCEMSLGKWLHLLFYCSSM